MMCMIAVMSFSRPPGVFIWITIAGAFEDFAIESALDIRLEDPGSTGTLKSTTIVFGCEAPWARGFTEAKKKQEKASASAETNSRRRDASFPSFGMPFSTPGGRSPDKSLSSSHNRGQR